MTGRFLRLYHTVVPLKLLQFWGLAYYRLLRRFFPFKPPAQETQSFISHDVGFPCYQAASWRGEYRFLFLNAAAIVDAENWQAEGESLLWHYNLQYFDCLHAVEEVAPPEDYARLVKAWWHHHEPLQDVAWEPYPTSLRAVNLCKWGWRTKPWDGALGSELWVRLLDRHYQEIRRKLEIHIQANHLFANLKALWFLQAALPEYLVKDGSWLCKQISTELAMQFDEDGGHFELSPMYHRIMLWDVLDMLHLGRKVNAYQAVLQEMHNLVPKALQWLCALSHPNGEEAFFNDSSMGVAPSLDALLAYAMAQGFTSSKVEDGLYSGYGVCRHGQAKLICDAAEVGAAIQPGHVHADSLSMELSIGLQRVLVNSGTSEYGISAERWRQRSTAAHSTVEFGGRNSSDVWSGFRVGKKARIVHRSLEASADKWMLRAAHNGYGHVLHERTWRFTKGFLHIADNLPVEGVKISHFYLHPAVQVQQQIGNALLLQWQGGSACFTVLGEGVEVQVQPATWHPEFGKVVPNTCLKLVWHGYECVVTLSWDE